MDKVKLKLAKRESRKPNELRAEGKLPATLYGPGIESQSVQVNEREFSKLPAAAFSHVIELDTESGAINAIIRNVQYKPINHKVLNVEFFRVSADHRLTVTVPLLFVGESPAIAAGGLLTEIYQEAEIECLPSDIPDNIQVDLSTIVEIDQGIHFSDLKVSGSVKILNPLDEIIARVVAPRVVVEEEKPAEATTATAEPKEGATEQEASAASKSSPATGKTSPAASKEKSSAVGKDK